MKVEKPTQKSFPYHTMITKVEKHINELIILVVLKVKKLVTMRLNNHCTSMKDQEFNKEDKAKAAKLNE